MEKIIIHLIVQDLKLMRFSAGLREFGYDPIKSSEKTLNIIGEILSTVYNESKLTFTSHTFNSTYRFYLRESLRHPICVHGDELDELATECYETIVKCLTFEKKVDELNKSYDGKGNPR